MAHVRQLPCNGDGICMLCKNKPPDEEMITCKTCVTPWHASCLAVQPETLASTLQWECPDCEAPPEGCGVGPVISAGKCGIAGVDDASGELVAAIRAIEADTSLTERQKASKRQQLVSGRVESDEKGKEKVDDEGNELLDVVGRGLNCSFCMQLPERPVTTPCGHNFCLKCFKRWTGQGKTQCAKCRSSIPPKMANQPRINSALVAVIRMAKLSKLNKLTASEKVEHFMHNQSRPDKAFTTERAKRAGKSNAASGKIFVTVPPDHFGPILADNDPERNRGVLVADCWEDRFDCRQWGAHMPLVAGICGQAKHGAQSVVLSGGYQDDEDHGEWFLYTGSGGRDLSGNKRTNKEQSFDQKFVSYNEALLTSCKKGYPVRVIRSHKEKRSSYAPEKGLRYDGIYRIEKCWRKVGKQGFKVCRYLFVRCDNYPAPWTSDEHGDKVRALPAVSELKKATDVMERVESPSWDYDEEEGCWKWKRPPPRSKKPVTASHPLDGKQEMIAIRKKSHNTSLKEKVLKGLCCLLCAKVMTDPLTTPCGHNFCKLCLEGSFAGQTLERERRSLGGRTLRAQKNIMKCPSCTIDIADFLSNPQVNRELAEVIEGLQNQSEDEDEGEGEGSDHKASDSMENDEAGPLAEDISERACKRLKVDVGDGSSNLDDNGKEIKEADEATKEGVDSPSSPLNVRSSDDDFQ